MTAPTLGSALGAALQREFAAAAKDLRELSATLPWAGIDGDTIDRALRRGARKADARRKALRRRPGLARWHDWRKAVRRVRYALLVLDALSPAVRRRFAGKRTPSGASARDLAKLGDRIGEMLDTSQLRERLRELDAQEGARALRRLATKRRAQCLRQLRTLLKRGGGRLAK